MDDFEARRVHVRLGDQPHRDRVVPFAQPPVGAERHGFAGGRARHGARPQVGEDALAGLFGEVGRQLLLDPRRPDVAPFADVVGQFGAKARRVVQRGLEDHRCHRIQVVGDRREAIAQRLERDGAAACKRVEHAQVARAPGVLQQVAHGRQVFGGRVNRERPRRAVIGVAFELDLPGLGPFDQLAPLSRVAADADEADKPLLIGFGVREPVAQARRPVGRPRGQHARQDRRAAGDQRPPRPPDVQEVERRQRARCAALALALRADRGDGEPGFDEEGGM